MSLRILRIEPRFARALLIAAAICCLALTWFFVRWHFANAIAYRLDFKRPEAKLVVDWLISIGPSDPQSHWAAAALFEKTFDAGDLERSLNEYELATALSPNNYFMWANLGKARSLNGDAAGAEAALSRALELAPNYASVQWAYGNLLIRQGKIDEGFKLAAAAAESNTDYARSAAVTALEIFDGDLVQVRDVLGKSETTNAALATTLAGQKHFEEAVESWTELAVANRLGKFAKLGESLSEQLRAANKFRLAAQVMADLRPDDSDKPVVGQIADGGFEKGIKLRGAGLFEWQIAEGAEPQVGMSESQKRSGKFGLFIVFNTFETSQFRSISQTVPVVPGSEYELEGFYRSDLNTTALIKLEIADAGTTGTISSTAPLSLAGDWATIKLKFSVPANSDGVIVRLVREGCSGTACRITGKLSFDDFSIKRL